MMRTIKSRLFDVLFLLFLPLVIAVIRLLDWWYMRIRSHSPRPSAGHSLPSGVDRPDRKILKAQLVAGAGKGVEQPRRHSIISSNLPH